MRYKSTLDQWLTLKTVDQAGSIKAAAEALNKSHTTLIYSLKKLEQQLNVKLLEVEGRRATLTKQGKALLRRADSMLEQARELENLSLQVSAGVESEITIAIDHLCNPALLYAPLSEYLKENNFTSIQVVETSLSKTTEMVVTGKADIAIITLPITNYPAQAFSVVNMVPVVSSKHPLAAKTDICTSDFTTLCQIVIRDLGSQPDNNQNVGWLKSNQRITVDNFDHALRAVEQGVGFCRLPTHIIEQRSNNEFKVLDVKDNSMYQVPLHITLPKGSKTGPAAKNLYTFLVQKP